MLLLLKSHFILVVGYIFSLWMCVFQALPNQQTVDYPSFKLVIVGDGGTGKSFLFVKESDIS